MKIRFRIKHPSGYLLLQGLRLTAHNWQCLLWACVATLPFGLLVGSPLGLAIRTGIGRWVADRGAGDQGSPGKIAVFLNHIASYSANQTGRQLAGNLNAVSLKRLILQTSWDTHLRQIPPTVLGLTLLGLAALLFIVAGTLYVYLGTEPPRFTVLLKSNARYFWRFLCALLPGASAVGAVLAVLIGLRHLLLVHVNKIHSAHAIFLYSAISAAVLVLAALPMLLWLDLLEVYAVRNSMLGNPRVRETLLPAFRLILRQFLWICSTFVLPGAIALGLLGASLFLWKTLTEGSHLWTAYLAAQLGLFLLLAVRFWQRGMEVALIIAVERSTTVAAVLSQIEPQTGQANPGQANPGQANPTLQELVLKLKKEPWARQDVPPLKTLFPEPSTKARSRNAPALPTSQAVMPPPVAPPAQPQTQTRLPATPPPQKSPQESPQKSPQEPPQASPQKSLQELPRESLLAKHAKKTSLLDATAEEPAPAPKPSEPAPKPSPPAPKPSEPAPGPRPVPGPDSSKR